MDFDEYVRRSYDPLETGPAQREINDLWTDRKCKLYVNDKWREAKVLSWSQWAPTPDYHTKWSLLLFFRTADCGDTVVVRGLNGAKQYNDKQGKILKFVKETERFMVEMILEGGAKKLLAIKPENLFNQMQDLFVKRMKVEGGGILHELGVLHPTLLSLEWTEPATPAINLDDDITVPSCPTCRSIEPAIAAFQEATLTTEKGECPVCLEQKHCRKLKCCTHFVCENCWVQWRRTTSCSVPELLVNDDRSIEYIQEERKKRDAEYLAMCIATNENDEATLHCTEQIAEMCRSLIEKANGGEDGLRSFRDEIMIASVSALLQDEMRVRLASEAPIPALEIFLHVLENRLDEVKLLDTTSPSGVQVEPTDFFFYGVAFVCCHEIGQQYEQMLSFRGAIPWYERCVIYAQRIGNPQFKTPALGLAYNNLGLAQKHNSFLQRAKETYEKGLETDPNNTEILRNLNILQEEMSNWTGSSGKLTPGC